MKVNLVISKKTYWYKEKRKVLESFVFYHTRVAAILLPKDGLMLIIEVNAF